MVGRIQRHGFIGCLLLLFSTVCGKVDISDFFPFGVGEGDSTVPAADDTFAGPIILKHPFSFFNISQTSLFVNNNGAISFLEGVRQYTATCGALPARMSMVAPFWADVHNAQGLGGAVYYRETTDRALLQKSAREIQAVFPDLWGLTIGWLFISTWHEVPFYGANGCGFRPNDPATPRNTFQAVLASDGRRSFAIFYYNKITWTTGTASGGVCPGLGGQPAKAGFDVGDGKTFHEVPGSCTNDIINIADHTNVQVPGKFIFRVDNTFDSPTCDSEKYLHERLQISPSFITVFGYVPIVLKGPCVNASMTISCKFNDPAQEPVAVTGTYQLINGTPSVECIVPHLYSYGRIRVDMITDYRGLVHTYSGFIYATEPDNELQIEVEPTDSGEWSILLTWEPTYFPEPTGRLSLILLEYSDDTKTWIEREILDDSIVNLGTTRITVDPVEVTSFISLSLRMKKSQSESQSTSYHNLAGFYKGAAARLLCAEALLTFDNDAACHAWYTEDDGPPQGILPCPPLLEQAIQDERFEIDETTGSTLEYFHPGAEFSFRQRTPSLSGSGQQCTYKDGHLILGPMGGGTAAAVSPSKSKFEHWRRDVVPWCQCCAYSERAESCRKYYEKRPCDNGVTYVPPPTGLGNGDPHITTFDLTTYTFNGVGEFWMIKSNSFSMQARMEQFIASDGTPTPASVFTAFVMKDTTTIQIQLSQSNGIDILLDGEIIVFDSNKKHRNLYTNTAAIAASEDLAKITVSLSSGYSFTFTSVENTLSIVAASSDTNKGKTQGLLGIFDGIVDNDLTAPDGTVTSSSASLRDIHYNFGIKWIIKSDESLFTYPNGQSYNDYANPSFEPSFVIPDINTLPPEVVDVCQDSLDCLYDYATTGSISLAKQTKKMEQEFNTTIQQLTQVVEMCPAIPSPENGYANVTSLFIGAEITFECNENFILVGGEKLTCGSELRWNSEVPACVDCRREGDHLPDPRDPNRFFHCSNGIAHSKKCPSTLHFNPSLQICDWPKSNRCSWNPLSSNRCRGERPTTISEITPTSEESSSSEDGICRNPMGLFSDPMDCRSYYFCSGGIAYLKECPPTLHFSPVLKLCAQPRIAKCVETLTPGPEITTTPSTTIFECPQSQGLFANPDSCTSFYQCDHGIPHFQSCPDNLHFNPTISVCDWPQNVGCTSRS